MGYPNQDEGPDEVVWPAGRNMTEREVAELGASVRREMDEYPSFILFRSSMRITSDLSDTEMGRKFLEWINQPPVNSGSTSSKF